MCFWGDLFSQRLLHTIDRTLTSKVCVYSTRATWVQTEHNQTTWRERETQLMLSIMMRIILNKFLFAHPRAILFAIKIVHNIWCSTQLPWLSTIWYILEALSDPLLWGSFKYYCAVRQMWTINFPPFHSSSLQTNSYAWIYGWSVEDNIRRWCDMNLAFGVAFIAQRSYVISAHMNDVN